MDIIKHDGLWDNLGAFYPGAIPVSCFKIIDMDPNRPPTEFENRVFEATRRIPKGKVTTYRELANYLDCNSAQAIGQALKRNPFAPEVPCHRVVRTDFTIGGFHGETDGPQLVKKRTLLVGEGVVFSDDGKIEAVHYHAFTE